jgi:hypothetical protein
VEEILPSSFLFTAKRLPYALPIGREPELQDKYFVDAVKYT